jgi:hypothetical protein
MMIVSFLFKSLDDYRKSTQREVLRPDRCPSPRCRRRNCFWRHTGYDRRVKDGGESVIVRIQRFRCKFCHLVISCLFSFLVAYRCYSAREVASSIENYTTAEETVALESYRKIAFEQGLSRMSVWRWTNLLGIRSQSLHGQVQKEFMLCGGSWQMLAVVPEDSVSPSSRRAKSVVKEKQLNGLFGLIAISKVFFELAACALEQLHAYFLNKSESRQLILTGRLLAKFAQQRMGRLFF